MKKLIMSLALLASATACATQAGSGPAQVAAAPSAPGAPDAVSAVRGFLAAAKEPDFQAMGGYFGDAQGPARQIVARQELEKRELIMARCLRHDTYDIVGDAPNPGGGRNVRRQPEFSRRVAIVELSGRAGTSESLVRAELRSEPAQDICSRRT